MNKTIVFVLALCLMTGVWAGYVNRPRNPDHDDPSRICLGRQHQKIFVKKYNLTKGQVEISFKVNIESQRLGRKAVVKVEWNGKTVYTILGCDDEKFVKLQVDARNGINTLKFCVVGEVCKVCICDLVLSFKRCCPGWGDDLVCNGGFEQNCCSSPYCIWSRSNFTQNDVPGWMPCPEIEIGRGCNYNGAALGDRNWVAELDANCNTCIKQRLLIRAGHYRLTFSYAARLNQCLSTSSFVIKINGRKLITVNPTDYCLHTQTIEFDLKTCPKESFLEFCGAGESDSYGAAIDNVSLEAYNPCANVEIVRI